MSTAISLKSLTDLKSRYESMQKRVKAVKEDAQEKVGIVVQAFEVGTVAFGMGVVNGRWNRPEFIGVPVDALTAILLHAGGFIMDGAGNHHLHNLGDGALASYMSGLGLGVGMQMRVQSLNPSGAPVAQMQP